MKKLYLDIETFPNICYTWGLFNQNVGLEQIVDSGKTACWAAKWEGQKKVHFSSLYHNSPEEMVTGIWHLLDQADIVVHYNGRKFDMPILNKEFVKFNIEPPSPYQQIDLLETVKRRFRFTSNKLDYVSQFLGLGSKVQHKGFSLWAGCMDDNKKDWDMMKEYNIQDVDLLPLLYARLLPWINNHPNMALFTDTDVEVCTNCGSTHIHKKGVERLATQSYQRYKCMDCGTNMKGRFTIIEPEKRKVILTQSKL